MSLFNVTSPHALEAIIGKGKKKFLTKVCKVCSSNGKRSESRYSCKLCRIYFTSRNTLHQISYTDALLNFVK
ncbi:hypothetical protein ANTPLA_LOCUS2637 [Anthophora plagiata]